MLYRKKTLFLRSKIEFKMLKIFDNKYRVNYNDADFTGKLSIPRLGNYILDTAGLHAMDLGISMQALKVRDMTWVISGLHFDFYSMPEINGFINIKTKISEYSKVTCKRDFFITDNDGKKIADVSSEWLIINTLTRRPVFLDEAFPEVGDLVFEKENQVEKYRHLRFNFLENARRLKYRVMYSDIDINAHLYSMRYLEMSLNMLGEEFFKSGRILSADLNFLSEVLCNQEVELVMQSPSLEIRQIEMRREEKPVFRVEFRVLSA